MALDAQIQRASVYGLIMGLWNNAPAHVIDPRALAEALNMRVEHMELRTAKGYTAHMATPVLSATAVRAMEFATRSDGTQDHLIAVSGGYWKIAANGAKTLISQGPARGLIADLSANSAVVSGDTDCLFLADVSVGDQIWLTADGIGDRVTVSAVSTNGVLILAAPYGGSAVTGAYNTWDKQADKPTSMIFWNDKWYFANSSDKLMHWDGSEFREGGMRPLAMSGAPVVKLTGGGGISANSIRIYKLAWEDDGGNYGNALGYGYTGDETKGQIVVFGAASAHHVGIKKDMSGLPPYPAWATKLQVYARTAREEAATLLVTHAVSAILAASGTYFTIDDGSYGISGSGGLAPAENYPPPAGLEHLEVYHDRLCGVKTQYFYCSGHLPTNLHSGMGGAIAGRYQPEVWRTTLRIGRGERNNNNALVAFRGNFYIFGSRTIWQVMAGSDNPDIWEIVSLLPNVGSESRWAIAPGGDKMFWFGRYNGRLTIFSFDARAVKPIGEPVWGSLSAADVSSLSAAAGGVGEGFYWLTFKTAGGYKTIEYNTDRGDGKGAWCERDWRMSRYCRSETEVYAVSASGVIHRLEDGYDAAGSDIIRRIQTHAFDLGSKVNWKDYRRLFTEIDVLSGSLGASAFSGWARRDENAYVGLAGYPIGAAQGKVKLEATSLGTVNGRRLQLRYSSSGKHEYVFRGFVIDGRLTEVDLNR